MVIPCLQDQVSSFGDDAQDTREFAGIKAVTFRYGDFGLQPDFGVPPATFDVNVPGLAQRAFVREKEIAQATIAKDDWHLLSRYANPYWSLIYSSKYVPFDGA
jgi:hypothetical protein